jgi:hypothetical protein
LTLLPNLLPQKAEQGTKKVEIAVKKEENNNPKLHPSPMQLLQKKSSISLRKRSI